MTRVLKGLPKSLLTAALTSSFILAFLSADSTGWAERRTTASQQEVQSARPNPFQRFAFIDSTSPAARTALTEHAGELDGLIGEWLTANIDGTIAEADDPEQDDGNIGATLRIARRAQRLQILAMLSDQGNEDGVERAFARLSDQAFRIRLEQEIIGSMRKYGFDGLVVNFEDPIGVDEEAFRMFLAELATQLRPTKKTIAVLTPGDWPVDYKALAALTDFVIVQLFNESIPGSGPLAPKPWSDRTAMLRAADVPADKLVFAVASLGRDWVAETPSRPVPFSTVMAMAAAPGAEIHFDETSGNPRLAMVDENGYSHEIWFLDAVTVFNQIGAVAPLAPKGVALWELGSVDESVWQLFKRDVMSNPPSPEALEQLGFDSPILAVGKGEVYRFQTRPTLGRRSIVAKSTSEIAREEYEVLPQPWTLQATGALPGAIALTFDDGPEPQYTERILDVLKRENVKATFFVVGILALQHPATIRRIVQEGHALGNHTFTHPNLSELPDWLVAVELNATQRLLQALTGSSVRLFRPPYATDDMATTPTEAHIVELASQLGYLSIGANLNSDDWTGLSKEEIVRKVVGKARAGLGSVVEFHDAGGKRNNTVEALPELISALRTEGFRFTDITELTGQAWNTAIPSSDHRWVSIAKVGFEGVSLEQVVFVGLIWACILITALRFLVLLICALLSRLSAKPTACPPLSACVIIPAHNEEKVIVRTIEHIVRSDYLGLREILVIDDGSTDNTVAVVEQAFAHDPRVRVCQKANGGKSRALNFGIEQTTCEVVVLLDADTLLEPDAIRLLASHFGDPTVGAVAGNAKVGNRVNLVTKLQALEYVTSQNLERAGLAKMDAITVIPGAIGMWRREAILQAGGFTPATLAEDCDLTLSIHRLGYKITHEMNAIGWTEAPQTWGSFMRQRFRWIYGTLQAAYRHSDAMFRPRFGALAFLSLPSIILFSVLLPLTSPIMDLILVMAIVRGTVDMFMHPQTYSAQSVIWAVAASAFIFVTDLLIAILAFALEPRESRSLLLYLPLQRICYRQVLYVVILQVLFASLRGNAQGWNKLARVGSVSLRSPEGVSSPQASPI
jgi:peptidoglycan-N-acetylglucosamine deacetylase